MGLKKIIDLDRLSRFKEELMALIPSAETDADVEAMLDSFELDYTSSTTSVNEWTGGEY